MNPTKNEKRKTKNLADRPKEHCGVFGIYGHPDAARIAYFGLYALRIGRVHPAPHPWRPGPGQR